MRISIMAFSLAVLWASIAPSVASADTWFECNATQVTEASNRVVARCSNTLITGGSNVIFFAIDKTDAARASRFIGMANAAVLSKQPFLVYAPTFSTTNTAGCQASDCRTPTSFGVRNTN